MKIIPWATAGDAVMGAPISYDQSSLPFLRSSTYRNPSDDPTTTRSPQMTGELSTVPRVRNAHRRLPVSRSRQCIRLSREPITTHVSLTAGDEKNGEFWSANVHTTFPFKMSTHAT